MSNDANDKMNELKNRKEELSTQIRKLDIKRLEIESEIMLLREKLINQTIEKLKDLKGLCFENMYGIFIVIDIPEVEHRTSGYYVDEYKIPILWFDKSSCEMTKETIYSSAYESDDPVKCFRQERLGEHYVETNWIEYQKIVQNSLAELVRKVFEFEDTGIEW